MKDSVGKILAITARNGRNYLDQQMELFQLGFGQFQIITELQFGESIKQIELADRIAIDKTTLTRTIRKLESLQYLRRIPNKSDSRSYDITLTVKGNKVRIEVLAILKEYTQKLLSGFSEIEKEQIYPLLIKILNNSNNLGTINV